MREDGTSGSQRTSRRLRHCTGWLGILYVFVRLSQSAGHHPCGASESKHREPDLRIPPNPTRCHRSLLLIGLLARLSGFDSQTGAHRSRKTQDPAGPFLPLHTCSHCHGKVTPASGCAHDGAQDGQPCKCFRELELGFFSGHETARRRIMCVATVDGKHGGFQGRVRMHACTQASWLSFASHNRPGTTFPHGVWV